MTELFKDIPEYIRIQTNFWIDLSLKQNDPLIAIQMIESYRNSCLNEYEKEYIDFVFNVKLEELTNN